MKVRILHQSDPEPSGAYFKVYVKDDYLHIEGRYVTLGEKFQYKTKDGIIAFLKTRWSMATYSMEQYFIRYTSKRQVKFKGYYNVLKDDEVKPAVSSALCFPEYVVWDISGLLSENGIAPNQLTVEEAVLNAHKTEWWKAVKEVEDFFDCKK